MCNVKFFTDMKRIILYAVCMLGFPGCAGQDYRISSEGPIVIGKVFELKYGQKRELKNTGLEIEILSNNDSRCPLNAECIRQGSAALTLSILRNKKHIGSVYIDAGETPKDEKIGIYKKFYFRLLSLYPYPTVGYDVKKSTAILSVAKGKI